MLFLGRFSSDSSGFFSTGSYRRPKLAIMSITRTASAAISVLLVSCSGDDTESRQDAVADAGAAVMPFDLDATTHRFEPTADGLVETVYADDPDGSANIRLIRDHLVEEEQKFERGNYGDPETIHGDEMPGLAELEAAAADVDVTFEETPDGARLVFRTDDPALVDALRRWGEAQTVDHGEHADQS